MSEDIHSASPPSGSRDLGLEIPFRVPPAAFQESGFTPDQSSGLFLGVSDFEADTLLAPIPYAVDDAVDLAWVFSCLLGLIRIDRVELCLSGTPKKETSRDRLQQLQGAGAKVSSAARVNVFKAMTRATQAATAQGMFICSIATHGFQAQGIDYFLVGDSLRSHPRQMAIAIAELEEDLQRTETQRRVLLVDTCRERLDQGPSTRRISGGMSASLADALGNVRGTVVISAAVAGGFAYDDETTGNGVFTRAIIDGLAGGAETDELGFIRAEHLAVYVQQRVREWVISHHPGIATPVGTQHTFAGEGRQLPLAIRPDAYELAQQNAFRQSFEGRRQTALQTLQLAEQWPGFTHQLIEEISAVLLRGRHEDIEALLLRLERLHNEGRDYTEDFLGWWYHRQGSGVSRQPAARRSVAVEIPPMEADISVSLDTIVEGGIVSFPFETPRGTVRLEVRIPRWTLEGEKIRLPGEGPSGEDVLLTVHHVAGRHFWMENGLLATRATVPYLTAYQGGRGIASMPGGDVRFDIPAGSESGIRIYVPAQGLPAPGGETESLIIMLEVEAPSATSETSSGSMNLSFEELLAWRPSPGAEIPGRNNWRIVEKLGAGGFGEAWLIEQPKSRERRVLKFSFEHEHVTSLRREVTLLRALYQSKNAEGLVAKMVDWNLDNPPHYLEFYYYELGSIADYSTQMGGIGKLPLEHRLEFMADVAQALSVAHAHSIVHRDVKPSNILLSKDDNGSIHALLGDFGIGTSLDKRILAAKSISVDMLTPTDKSSLSAQGTRLYLAPELLENRPATPASDLYALGVTLFQIVVGRLDHAIGHGWEDQVRNPVLCEIIASCIHLDPSKRHMDAKRIHRELSNLVKNPRLLQQQRSSSWTLYSAPQSQSVLTPTGRKAGHRYTKKPSLKPKWNPLQSIWFITQLVFQLIFQIIFLPFRFPLFLLGVFAISALLTVGYFALPNPGPYSNRTRMDSFFDNWGQLLPKSVPEEKKRDEPENTGGAFKVSGKFHNQRGTKPPPYERFTPYIASLNTLEPTARLSPDENGNFETLLMPGEYAVVLMNQNTVYPIETIRVTEDKRTFGGNIFLSLMEANVAVIYPPGATRQDGRITLTRKENTYLARSLSMPASSKGVRINNVQQGDYTVTYYSNDGIWNTTADVEVSRYPQESQAVLLPFRNRVQVGQWNPLNTPMQFSEVDVDLTPYIQNPGLIEIVLLYEKGADGIACQYVRLEMNGREIGRDEHEGWSGYTKKNHVYRLNVPAFNQGTEFTAHLSLRGTGESYGQIMLVTY